MATNVVLRTTEYEDRISRVLPLSEGKPLAELGKAEIAGIAAEEKLKRAELKS